MSALRSLCSLVIPATPRRYLNASHKDKPRISNSKMKTTAFLIFCVGVLIGLNPGVLARSERDGNWKAEGVKEEVPRPRPSFPLLTLPSFSSFSLPALNFPYLQAFSLPNRMSSPERIKATKTEYVEVTRRQTVHPMCYTAYESKAPCLSYGQADFLDDDYDTSEPEAVYHSHDGFVLNEVRKAAPVTEIQEEENNPRNGKYLELKLRRDGLETSSRIEGSEFGLNWNRPPHQHKSTEYHTKTVLITKLEKYTDRRVTATLLAVNCLPVDRSIPMCQTLQNPIRESPDRRSDVNAYESGVLPTPVAEEDSLKENPELIPEGTKTDFGSSEMNAGGTLIGED